MDPISVLALTCNILDLVTAAGKTCHFLYSTYKAGTLPAHAELTATTTLLDTSLQSLENALQDPGSPNQALNSDDKDLLDILLKSRRIAAKLKKKLSALQVQASDSRGKRAMETSQMLFEKGKSMTCNGDGTSFVRL